MVTMIALGIQDNGAPVKPFVETNLVTGFIATCNIAFSYGESGYRAQRKSSYQKKLDLPSFFGLRDGVRNSY
jgi:hypothetical protein